MYTPIFEIKDTSVRVVVPAEGLMYNTPAAAINFDVWEIPWTIALFLLVDGLRPTGDVVEYCPGAPVEWISYGLGGVSVYIIPEDEDAGD